MLRCVAPFFVVGAMLRLGRRSPMVLLLKQEAWRRCGARAGLALVNLVDSQQNFTSLRNEKVRWEIASTLIPTDTACIDSPGPFFFKVFSATNATV